MRVLLTGASSFTGLWFLRALARRGAEIVAATRRPLAAYDGLPAARLARARRHAALIASCPFGSPAFLDLLDRAPPFDLLCLHGAEAAGHRDDGFDALAALAANCRNAEAVFERLAARGRPAVLVTGSIFEADAGTGSPPRGAVGAYGLSKTLTWQVVRYHAEQRGLTRARFVVPHPLGAFEKPGLTSGFARAWLAGQVPILRQPRLVRDFVPVDRLAESYAGFALDLRNGGAERHLAPSGWAEATAAFVARFARAVEARLKVACRFEPAQPPEPTREPLVRRNTDPLDALAPGWREGRFWDGLARWYRRSFTDINL